MTAGERGDNTARCEAQIWPAHWSGWGQCPGYVRPGGRCSAYGHHLAPVPAADRHTDRVRDFLGRYDGIDVPDWTEPHELSQMGGAEMGRREDARAADRQTDEEQCAYGHTEAEHEAVGACRRPSLDSRSAGHAAFPGARVTERIAYERGWDDALATRPAAADALLATFRDRDLVPGLEQAVTAGQAREAVRDTAEHRLWQTIREWGWARGVTMLDSDVADLQQRLLALGGEGA